MATHCNILARKIQWTEESGRLQFMALHGFAKSRTQLKRLSSSSSSIGLVLGGGEFEK